MALPIGIAVALLAYVLLHAREGEIWKRFDRRIEYVHRHLVGQMADIELSTVMTAYWLLLVVAFCVPAFAWPGSVVAGLLVLMATTVAAPRVVVELVTAQRRRRIEKQMVDGLRLCANALSAGLSLPQAFQLLADQGPRPLADEVALMMKEYELGVPLGRAMEHMAARLANEDFTMTVVALGILRETGGDLTETFERMVEILRDRARVFEKVRTVSAQGRMEASLVSASPFVLLGVMYLMNPDTIGLLLTTPFGWFILFTSAGLALAGWLMIRKLLDVPV